MIDTTPFYLYLTTLGNKPYVIEFKVSSGFSINPWLRPEDFHALVDYLGLERNPYNKFSTISFFNEIDAILPTVTMTTPNHTDILRTVSQKRDVEEADKIYFLRWKKLPEGQNVSPENKQKTSIAFGESRAEVCANSRISSCWTDRPELATDPNTPPI